MAEFLNCGAAARPGSPCSSPVFSSWRAITQTVFVHKEVTPRPVCAFCPKEKMHVTDTKGTCQLAMLAESLLEPGLESVSGCLALRLSHKGGSAPDPAADHLPGPPSARFPAHTSSRRARWVRHPPLRCLPHTRPGAGAGPQTWLPKGLVLQRGSKQEE